MNKKLAQILIITTAIIFISLLYFFVDARTVSNFFPQCIFHSFTGLYCPGCGSQRAFSALLHGDIISAIHYNILMVLSLPLFIYSAMVFVLNALRKKQIQQKIFYSATFAKSVFVVVILFGVMRNIPVYPFNLLAPV